MKVHNTSGRTLDVCLGTGWVTVDVDGEAHVDAAVGKSLIEQGTFKEVKSAHKASTEESN